MLPAAPQRPCKNFPGVLVDTATTMNTQPTITKTGKQNSGILPCKNPGGLLVVVSVMQPQPTSKPSPAHPNRCDDSAAGQSGHHLQLSPRIFFRRAVQGDAVSQRVGLDRDPFSYIYGGVTVGISVMKIQLQNKSKPTLTPEGLYPATIKAISVKNKKGTEVPGSVIVEFALNGRTESLLKDYPPSLEEDSPLLKDSLIVLGRCLAPDEVSDGFDPDVLKDRACQVVVGHRVGSDGSFTPYASVVMGAVPMPSN